MATNTYNHSGADQNFVVPTGVTSLTVDVRGGKGGDGNGGSGGNGRRITGTLAVTPGETLTLRVGGLGASQISSPDQTPPTYGGGGQGGRYGGNVNGAAGGGASSILRGGSNLVIAGGGGGAGSHASQAGGSGAGGGAGSAGSAGRNEINSGANYGYTPPQGGGAGSGGSGGSGGARTDANSNTSPGGAGSATAGGTGGDAYGGYAGSGGGGGGGWGGGGGGAGGYHDGQYWSYAGAGGGGGGSLTSGLTGVTDFGAVQTQAGQIYLTYNLPPNTPTSLSPSGAQGTNTVLLSAVVSEPDGDNVRAEFRVNGVTYNGSTVGSGGTSTYSFAGAANTTYTLDARAVDSTGAASGYTAQQTFTTNRPPAVPVITAPNGGEVWNASHTITWTGGADPDGQTTTIDVELTRDNGTTWTRLLTGTPNDGTQAYDFTNIQASTACRLRLRSVDTLGSASGWDESNANFTIEHNRAPTAPSLGAPADGTTLDRAVVQRFNHVFNDPDTGDTQSKFDFEYRLVGATPWTVLTRITTNQFIDVDAGTFAVGNYERRVRTYDSQGVVSPYSATGFFTAANVPAGPTILTPTNNGSIPLPLGIVEWSYPSQAAYQVRRLGDLNGAPDTAVVYQDTGIVENTSTRTVAADYAVNNRYEHVQVRVRDTNGLWTTYTSHRVLVSYTQPPAPLVNLESDNELGHIKVIPDNPKGNLLTANQASLETDVTGWVTEANATVARSTAQASNGSASLSITAVAAGTASARTSPAPGVSAGLMYTAVAEFRAAATARSTRLRLVWRDAANAILRTDTSGTFADVTTGWQQARITAQAPNGAAKVEILPDILSAAAAEVHYVDKIGLFQDANNPVQDPYPWTFPYPKIAANEIWRRQAGVLGDGERISLAAPSEGYIDATVAHDVEYEYRARAVADTGPATYGEWTA